MFINSSTDSQLDLNADKTIFLNALDVNFLNNVNITPGLLTVENFTIGTGAAGVDYTLTFDGESNDGILTFEEDESQFSFDNTVLIRNATNPAFGAIDTTNSVIAVLQAQNSLAFFGTTSNHPIQVVSNNTLAFEVGTDQNTTFSGGGAIFNDNLAAAFGTSSDATISYNSTDLIINQS